MMYSFLYTCNMQFTGRIHIDRSFTAAPAGKGDEGYFGYLTRLPKVINFRTLATHLYDEIP